MDGDFSHTIVDLQNLIKFKDEFDLVIGSRYIKGGKTEGWSNGRKLLSMTANKAAKILLGTKVNGMTSGFRIYSKECLEVLEKGNMINLIDGIYPVIVYKGHSYFIQTDYMGGNKAYICKSKKKLITN